jgi:gliding motility-associated-like protein
MVVIASGGTPLANGDYSYLWSNGATTSLVTSMSAGTYTVTVTDANGCSLSRTASIGQGGSINLSITNRVTVTCFGGNNGAATAVASGGTGPLSFQWNDLAGQTTATATGLSAGTYTVVVSDQNGCTRQDSVVIPQDAQVRIGSVATDVRCFGGSDGSIRLNSPTRPISLYEWSTGAIGANLNQINNLSAGNYQVTVTTSLGCTASFEYSIGQPDSFSLALSLVRGLACATDTNAVVEVSPQGGRPNYSYVWSNGRSSTNVRLGNLDAGAYSVIATDRNGCTATGSINITAPSPLALSTTVTDASCANVANGSIQVAATGGTVPSGLYAFSLDRINWQTGNLFPALLGNIYQVYVRDDNGCINSVQTTVQDGDPFFIVAATADTTIQYGDTLGLEVKLNDTSNVRLQWSIVGSGNPILDSLNYLLPVAPMEESIYRFTAVNGPGCSLDTQIVVKIEKRRYANAPTGFTPNGDGVNDRFFVQGETDRIRSVKIFRVYDRWGELVYEVQNANLSDPQLGWDGSLDGKKLNSGVFAWYAEIEFIDGKVEVFKGDVTLLR